MTNKEIWEAIEKETRKAKKKFPGWPQHPCGQAGIVVEEAGELMKACLQWKYERAREDVVQEVQQEEDEGGGYSGLCNSDKVPRKFVNLEKHESWNSILKRPFTGQKKLNATTIP